MTTDAGGELGERDVEIEVEGSQAGGVVGIVRRAGAHAGDLTGQRVLAGPIDPCGECEVCRRGGAPVCPTARRRAPDVRSAHLVAAARWVVPLVDELELPGPTAAAVAGEAAIAYTMYARTGIGPREPTVVVGTNPVTRFLVDVLIAKGIVPVVVADPTRAAWSAHLTSRGATVVAPDEAQPRALAWFTEQGLGNRPWRVIATSPDAVPAAAALCGPRATLTVPVGIDALPGTLADLEVSIIAVAAAHPDLLVEVAAMCVRGELDLVGSTTTSATSADADLRALVATPQG